MSSEWCTSNLLDHYDIRSGLSKPAKDFGSGYPFLTFKDVFYNYFTPETLGDSVQSTEKERESCSVFRGDVFLTRTSETMHELGMSCVALKDYENATFNGFCKRLRPKPDCALIPEYVGYYLRSPKFRQAMVAFSTMSTRASLNNEMIGRLEISYPSKEVQTQIAEVLKSLDDRITLLRKTNATLEAIAQALFKSWFVDFDPVRAKQEGRAPEGIDDATAALFPDGFEESELGLVPKGWRVEFIDALLDVLETGRRPKGGVSGYTAGVPSIGAESIVRIGQFDYTKTKFVPEEFFSKMNSGELQSHDVLLYKDGGKPGVFLPRVSMFGDGFPFERCGINEHVFRIRVKPPLNQAFLYFWVWSDAVMHELKHRGGKAAIPGINQSDVRELKLAVPNEEVLIAFDELTSPLISKIFSNAMQAKTLATLRDTLLPRLISGQLRLPEAEALAA